MRYMSPKKKRSGTPASGTSKPLRNTSISLPDELYQEVKERADAEERSVSGYVTRLLREALSKMSTTQVSEAA